MLEYVLTFITFVLFATSARKVGFPPFPTFLILFLGVSQVMSILTSKDIVPYAMHTLYDFGGLRTNLTTVHIIYTLVALIALLSLSGKFKALKSVDLTGTLRRLLNTEMKSRFLWVLLAIVLCSIHLMLYLLVVDWNELWYYDTYLSVGMDAKWVVIFGDRFSDAILKMGAAFAILSCLCVCALIGTRHTTLKVLASALTLFWFTNLVSQHSRAAVFFPLLLAFNFALLRLKGRTVVIPILLVVAAIAIMGALIGRGTGRHGFSALPETITSPFVDYNPIVAMSYALMDLCQGIIVTVESLQLTVDFNPWYKILPFSPLPSFIDGYSSIREASEYRLHDFVPMSGVGEVYHFGWFYVGLLLIGYIALIRAHTKIASKNPAIFILCNLLITLSLYILFAYPLRNALRFYWIAVVLLIAADFAGRRSAKANQSTLRRRNVMSRWQTQVTRAPPSLARDGSEGKPF